jgi:hypothetical protein
MATILETLSCIAPEFDSVAVAIRNCIIGLAENQVDSETFEADYEGAVAYLAAHMLTIGQYKTGNIAGPTTMKREGDLQLQAAMPTSIDESSLSDTAYGREFLRFRNLHVVGALCVD